MKELILSVARFATLLLLFGAWLAALCAIPAKTSQALPLVVVSFSLLGLFGWLCRRWRRDPLLDRYCKWCDSDVDADERY